MAEGAAILGALGLGLQAVTSKQAYNQQREAQSRQDKAIADAEAKQTAADTAAETKRLESLAASTTGENARIEKFNFGIDSAAAQTTPAIKAVTSTTTTDEENEFNPFYSRGLV